MGFDFSKIYIPQKLPITPLGGLNKCFFFFFFYQKSYILQKLHLTPLESYF